MNAIIQVFDSHGINFPRTVFSNRTTPPRGENSGSVERLLCINFGRIFLGEVRPQTPFYFSKLIFNSTSPFTARYSPESIFSGEEDINLEFGVFCNFSNIKSNDFFTNNSSSNQSLLSFKKKTRGVSLYFYTSQWNYFLRELVPLYIFRSLWNLFTKFPGSTLAFFRKVSRKKSQKIQGIPYH